MKKEFKEKYIENILNIKKFKIINKNNVDDILLNDVNDFIIDLKDKNINDLDWFLGISNLLKDNIDDINYMKKNYYFLETFFTWNITNLILKKVNHNYIFDLAYDLEWRNQKSNLWIPIKEIRESYSGESLIFKTEKDVFTIKYENITEEQENLIEYFFLYLKFSKKDIKEKYKDNNYIRLTSIALKRENIDSNKYLEDNFKNPIKFDKINYYNFENLKHESTILVRTKKQFEKWTSDYNKISKRVKKLYDHVKNNFLDCKIAVVYVAIENEKWVLKHKEFKIPNKKLLN